MIKNPGKVVYESIVKNFIFDFPVFKELVSIGSEVGQ